MESLGPKPSTTRPRHRLSTDANLRVDRGLGLAQLFFRQRLFPLSPLSESQGLGVCMSFTFRYSGLSGLITIGALIIRKGLLKRGSTRDAVRVL